MAVWLADGAGTDGAMQVADEGATQVADESMADGAAGDQPHAAAATVPGEPEEPLVSLTVPASSEEFILESESDEPGQPGPPNYPDNLPWNPADYEDDRPALKSLKAGLELTMRELKWAVSECEDMSLDRHMLQWLGIWQERMRELRRFTELGYIIGIYQDFHRDVPARSTK